MSDNNTKPVEDEIDFDAINAPKKKKKTSQKNEDQEKTVIDISKKTDESKTDESKTEKGAPQALTYHPKDWNPYVAGFALGLVVLLTYVFMGWGIGASAAATRVSVAIAHIFAPVAIENNGYFSQYFVEGLSIFDNWMIFEAFGVLLGGVIGAYTAGRMRVGEVERGPNVTIAKRFFFALLGGIIMGFAARLGRGCTSGQALTGGSVFAVGSWLYMIFVFVGGYIAAPFVRRVWR